jgi:hypothetical protein
MKRAKTAVLALACLGFLLFPALSQSAAVPTPQPTAGPGVSPSPSAPEAPAGEKPADVPSAFRDFSLGMGLDEAKAALQKESLLAYAGDPDVSMLPSRKETLIDVQGASFIKRASFQFVDDKLYVMIFSLDSTKVDHYSVYSAMVKKYGKPSSVSPEEIFWSNDKTKVSIERPLTVKYLDLGAYNGIMEKSVSEKSYREMRRDMFLDSF